MIGKLYQKDGRFCFDCYDCDTFADLLTEDDVQHVGGPTFALAPGKVVETYAELTDTYGAVVSVPDETKESVIS